MIKCVCFIYSGECISLQNQNIFKTTEITHWDQITINLILNVFFFFINFLVYKNTQIVYRLT